MTNDPFYLKMRELSWRRKLTPAEEAELRHWLAAHVEAQADWEADVRLSEALDQLPDAPVPTNFTANVLQAVEREDAAQARMRRPRPGWWQRLTWLPRGALAALAVVAGLLSYMHGQTVRRDELRNSVVVVLGVKSLPSPEVLRDFDVIRALDQTPPADEQLLTLLQ